MSSSSTTTSSIKSGSSSSSHSKSTITNTLISSNTNTNIKRKDDTVTVTNTSSNNSSSQLSSATAPISKNMVRFSQSCSDDTSQSRSLNTSSMMSSSSSSPGAVKKQQIFVHSSRTSMSDSVMREEAVGVPGAASVVIRRKKRRIHLENHNEKLLLVYSPSSMHTSSRSDVDDVSSVYSGMGSGATVTKNISVVKKEEALLATPPTKSNNVSSNGSNSSNSSLNKKRRYISPRCSSLGSSCSTGSSSCSSTREASMDKTVLGAGADVLAVQDAGSFRLDYEHCCYLCSTVMSATRLPNSDSNNSDNNDGSRTIRHSKATYHALAELANRMCLTKQRKSVIVSSSSSSKEGVCASSAMNALLSVFETVPSLSPAASSNQQHSIALRTTTTKSSRRKACNNTNHDNSPHSYDEKAALSLSIILYFISIDIGSSLTLQKLIMKHHLLPLLGMVRLCSFEIWLRPHLPTPLPALPCTNSINYLPSTPVTDTEHPSYDSAPTTTTSASYNNTNKDPTSLGRRSRKRKQQQKQQLLKTTYLLPAIKDEEPDATTSYCSSSQEFNSPLKTPTKMKENNFDWRSSSTTSSISSPSPLLSRSLSPTNSSNTNAAIASPSTPTNTAHHDTKHFSPTLEPEEDTILLQAIQQIFSHQLQHDNDPRILFADDNCDANCPYQKHQQHQQHQQHQRTNTNQYALQLEKASGTLALIGLKRILSLNSIEDSTANTDNTTTNNNPDEISDENNPVLYINNALFQSNALPQLANIMVDTISTIILLLNTYKIKSEHNEQTPTCCCHACFYLLQHRFNTIQSILDDTCCLVQPTTQSILSSVEIGLVSSLLNLISTCFFQIKQQSYNNNNNDTISSSYKLLLSDLILSSLQTLVSVTHENTLAVHQFINFRNEKYSSNKTNMEQNGGRGATLIFELIYYISNTYPFKATTNTHTEGGNNETSKHTYDTLIYCLNILTNVMEVMISSSSSTTTIAFQKHILQLTLGPPSHTTTTDTNQQSAILWLSSWLVSITTTYQNAIIRGSFGKTETNNTKLDTTMKEEDKHQCKTTSPSCSNEERELTKQEKESLVLAGNGFIFLIWFMKQPLLDKKETSTTTLKEEEETTHSTNHGITIIRKQIFSLMPCQQGKLFITNTLKAFSNFYHYSIGELSFAVVGPVGKLIMDLEKL